MSESKPKRRWFKFSLRTLLIVVAIVGAAMGWIVSELRQLHRENIIVQQFEQEGAEFTLEGWAMMDRVGINCDGQRLASGQ